MPDEAPLVEAPSGLVPGAEGWYVVNARDAAWAVHERFGARATFDASLRLVGGTAIEPRTFEQLGCTLSVLQPGERSGLYHSESLEECFLVLRGRPTLVVEEQERQLEPWDFLYCPPGTLHAFHNAGDEQCVIFMVGARGEGKTIRYPRTELALAHGLGVERETDSPQEAYAAFPHWRPGRSELPFREPR